MSCYLNWLLQEKRKKIFYIKKFEDGSFITVFNISYPHKDLNTLYVLKKEENNKKPIGLSFTKFGGEVCLSKWVAPNQEKIIVYTTSITKLIFKRLLVKKIWKKRFSKVLNQLIEHHKYKPYSQAYYEAFDRFTEKKKRKRTQMK